MHILISPNVGKHVFNTHKYMYHLQECCENSNKFANVYENSWNYDFKCTMRFHMVGFNKIFYIFKRCGFFFLHYSECVGKAFIIYGLCIIYSFLLINMKVIRSDSLYYVRYFSKLSQMFSNGNFKSWLYLSIYNYAINVLISVTEYNPRTYRLNI